MWVRGQHPQYSGKEVEAQSFKLLIQGPVVSKYCWVTWKGLGAVISSASKWQSKILKSLPKIFLFPKIHTASINFQKHSSVSSVLNSFCHRDEKELFWAAQRSWSYFLAHGLQVKPIVQKQNIKIEAYVLYSSSTVCPLGLVAEVTDLIIWSDGWQWDRLLTKCLL